MEHRPRHSRARRRHAASSPRLGGDRSGFDLTAADLRALRTLLEAEDRADTPEAPRTVADPDRRPDAAPRYRDKLRRRAATEPAGAGGTGRPRHGAASPGGPAWPKNDEDVDNATADTVVGLRRVVEPDPDAEDLDEDHDDRSSTARRVLVGARRGLAGLLSLAVLIGSGYGWASVNNLRKNLNTSNVISAVPKDVPSDGATDILLVGSDSRTDANGVPLPLEVLKLLRTEESSGLNTDTIILIRVPEDGGNAYAVSIPRDTYVPIPGYREDRINAAYGVSKRTATEKLRAEGATDEALVDRQAAAAGQRVLVQTVEQLTGARVDHYAEINLYGFYLLTEAIGGVEVCLRRNTADPDSGADFKKGRQTVSGGDALAFVRQRKNLPRGDLDRIVRQQVFMAALANRMLGAGTLTDPGKLSGLMDAAQRSVILDDGWDVLGFAAQLQGLAGGDVEFVTIPVVEVGFINERGQNVITVDQAAVHTFITGLLADQPATEDPGTPLATPPTTGAAPPPTPVDASSVVVTVRNGTSHSGLAGRVMAALAERGYRTGAPDNASRRPDSEVRVAPTARAVGEQLAVQLGGMAVVEDATFTPDKIRVTLGENYAGPGLQGFATGPLVHLDGATGAPLPARQPTPDDDAPITAEGITCVN